MDLYYELIKNMHIKKTEQMPENVWYKLISERGLRRASLMLQYEYGAKVLEIGPGRGYLATIICKAKRNIKNYVGLEIEERYRTECEEMAHINNVLNATFILGDGARTSFDDKIFETVIIAEVLEHVYNP